MINYNLGKNITGFTTDRTVGREPSLLCPLLGVSEQRFARPHQTHTDRVLHTDGDFFNHTAEQREEMMDGIDAVISDVTDACIGISTADCIPVLVYDPEHHACAAIHAGWRGTVQSIVVKTIKEMQRVFASDPSQCRAAIGPGISLESFEVGDEVYAEFISLPMGEGWGGAFSRYPSRFGGERWHIDLKEINRLQLLACGLKAEAIEVSDIDTFTDERFFSARREQKGDIKCGRILTGFVLR